MASSSAHDFFFQEANTISFVHSLISRAWRHLDVTHVPLVIQALLYSRDSLKLCEKCGSNCCVRAFFIPWGQVDFYDQIWALWRQLGHMTSMLDSDWWTKFLLRSDWSGPIGASFTTMEHFLFMRSVEHVFLFMRSVMFRRTLTNRRRPTKRKPQSKRDFRSPLSHRLMWSNCT